MNASARFDVLYFADTRFPIERANGVQTMETCHALASRGHRVTLVTRADSAAVARDPFEFYGLPPLPALEIVRLASPSNLRLRRVRFLLAALAHVRRRPDALVYTRDLGLAAFLLQVPGRRRPAVIYESHGVAPIVTAEMPRLLGRPELEAPASKLRRLDRRERHVWLRASAYVTITRALAEELAARYGPRRDVFVAPDGARGDTCPAAPLPPPFVVGYAGHLYPWKGADVLVQAIARLPDVHGLIVGGHPREPDRQRVERLVADLGLAPRVTITGLVPPREVMQRLSRAHVLALPNTASAISERYTSPLKLFEYLAMGRPIVASDLPALREILTANETAILVPPGDAEALAKAIARVAADPDLASRLGRAAAALARRYTWEARAERLEPALRAAVAS